MQGWRTSPPGAQSAWRYLYDYNNCVTPTSWPRADLDQLADTVLTASRVLVSVAARSLAEHEHEISVPQYRALVVLGSRGPQRPVDLADALAIDPSTATRLCDRLVEKRLISRRRQGVDRREVRLELAPRGRQLVDDVSARRRQEIKRILQAVPTTERAGLVRAFVAFATAAGEIPDSQWPRSWEI